MKKYILFIVLFTSILGAIQAQSPVVANQVANGQINASVYDPATQKLYVAGDFTAFGNPNSANFASVYTSGAYVPNTLPSCNGQVNKIIVDGSNLFIVGKFTRVNGVLRMGIVKLNAARQVDPSFNPSIDFSDTSSSSSFEINDIEQVGNTIAISGKFRVNGALRRVALLDKVTGVAFNWSPNIDNFNSSVNCLSIFNNQLFIGGDFSVYTSNTLSGTVLRRSLAVYNISIPSSPVLLNNNYGLVNTNGAAPIVYSFALNTTTLYIGGDFSGGLGFGNAEIFAINAQTGTRITGFNAGITSPSTIASSAYVSSIEAVSANQIFIGGQFYTPSSAGVVRYNFALINSAGNFSNSSAFNIASYNQTVIRNITSVNLGSNICRIFISGPFTSILNSNNVYQGVTVYDYNLLTNSFNQNTTFTDGTAGPVNSSIYDAGTGTIILGGAFSFAGGTRCPHFAVFNNSGNLDMSQNNSFLFNSYGNMSIKSMEISGSYIYLGGSFKPSNSSITTLGRNDLMRISKISLATDLGFPQLDATLGNAVNSIVVDGSNVYVGGSFSKYLLSSGLQVSKNNFFGYNISTNSTINFSGSINGVVNDIAFNASNVYAVGNFTAPIVGSSNGIAKFSKSALSIQPFPNTNSHSTISAIEIINSNIYVAEKNAIYVYDPSSNLYKAKYNLPTPVTTEVSTILPVSSNLFIAGFNGNKLYYNQTHNSNVFQNYSMIPDARVSESFRLLNYFPSQNLFIGVNKANLRYDFNGWTTVFSNGKNTFASFNNNLVLPPPPLPTIDASAVNFNATATTISMSWTSGNGDRRMVLARKDADPIIPTVIPSTITSNSSFGSGTNLGSATFCVYDGTGSSAIVNNLQNLSNYRFVVIEYNVSNSIKSYKTINVPVYSCSTLDFTPPNVATNSIQVVNKTISSLNLSWTNGNGSDRLVLIKPGANSISFTPVAGLYYFNNQTLSDGSIVASVPSGSTNFNFTGLNPGITYSFAFIEFNIYAGAGPRYCNSITKINATTSAFAPLPTTQCSNVLVSAISTTSANITWTRGSGGRSVVLITKNPSLLPIASPINAVDGFEYGSSSDLNTTPSNSIINCGQQGNTQVAQVVYNGTGNSVNITNLVPGSTYQLAVFESNGGNFGSLGQVVYLTQAFPTGAFTTVPLINAPSTVTNNHSILVSQDDAKLSWTGGNGANSLVLIKKGGPVSFVPANDVLYAAVTNFGTGTQLGASNFAVYSANSAGSVNITNLEPDAEYHFAIFDYNTQSPSVKYNANPYRGLFKTAKAWPIRAGGAKKDAGGGVVTDASGNVYVAGAFEQFGSWGTVSIPSYGSQDIFLSKFSATGKPIWVVKQGGSSADAASSLALDVSGNIVMTGSFRGTGTFGQGNILASNGIDDIFISKLNPSGNVIWSKRAGGIDQDVAYAITTDLSGNIYIAGYFRGTITFPNSSTTLTSMGGTDALIAKYDSSGNLVWAKSAGGTANDFAYGVTVNGNNVAMVGQFDGSANFGTTVLTSSGFSDIFLSEYNASTGSLNWVNKFGGAGTDIGFAITTAANDYVITGQFSNLITIGTTTLNSVGNSDILICKVNATGTPIWSKRAGGASQDAGRGITLNGTGDKLFVTGSFAETAMFGTNVLTSFGNLDVFITTVDLASGNFETTYQNGGPADDEARGITANSTNSSFVTGYFNGQGTFGNVDLTAAGDWDIFIHKFTLVVTPELSNGLVAWYKMNGNANDASGNGNNGTAQNINATPDRSNDPNGAYLFQQNTNVDVLKVDPVNVAGASTTTTSSYLAWIKTPANYSNSYVIKPIFTTSLDDVEYRSIQLSDIGTISYAFFSPNASLQLDQTSLTPIQDNTWHHIGVVFKAGIEVIFYLDGNEIGRKSLSNFFEPETMLGTHWNIGHLTYADRLTPIYSFNGSIDDVRIYRRALSSAEISSIKNQSSTLAKNELVLNKKMETSSEIKLWPNPNSGILNVNLGTKVSNLQVKIIDISGNEVLQKKFNAFNDSNLSIDVQHLATGYYFVQFEIEGQTQIKKMVITK